MNRALRHPLARLVLGSGAVVAAAALASMATRALQLAPSSPLRVLAGLSVAALVIAAYKAQRRWLEGGPDAEMPRRGLALELSAGLMLGAALFAVVAGGVMLAGAMKVVAWRPDAVPWTLLAGAMVSSVFEECWFRGIVLRQLEAMLGSWRALMLSSALFGLAHLMNREASLFAALAVAVEAGLLLGAAFLLTRRLWLPIGIHAAWNFTQGWIFGVPVSGSGAAGSLLVTTRQGPPWLTGAGFGLEASVPAIVIAALAGTALLAAARRRGSGWLAP